jgi:non-specific serine/threonine protein kinase
MFGCIGYICNRNSHMVRQSDVNIQPQVNIIHCKLLQQLGNGGTSVVYKVLNKKDNEFYTCKILPSDKKFKAYREAQVLKKLSGDHFPKFKGLFCIEKKMHILIDYIEGEELFEHITNKFKDGPIKFDEICQYSLKMASIIKILHSFNIVHLDIKMENFILVNDNPITLKLIDFGTAHPIVNKLSKINTVVGTLGYSAIEIYNKYYHQNSDIWSLGVIIWVLITHKLPFDHSTVSRNIKSGEIPTSPFIFPTEKHNEYKELMSDKIFNFFPLIFKLLPDERPGIDDVCNFLKLLLINT